MAATKKSSKSSSKGITKSGFIRTLPDRTPAKEVIAKAKEAGLDLNEKFVWTIQSEMRSKAKGPTTAGSTAAAKAAPKAAPKAKKSKGKKKKKSAATKQPAAGASAPKASAPVTRSSSAAAGSAEHKIKALIVELGTSRAEEIFRSLRKDIDSILSK